MARHRHAARFADHHARTVPLDQNGPARRLGRDEAGRPALLDDGGAAGGFAAEHHMPAAMPTDRHVFTSAGTDADPRVRAAANTRAAVFGIRADRHAAALRALLDFAAVAR